MATTTTTMKAAVATSFGQPNDVLKVDTSMPKPSSSHNNLLLIRVHACSLSPSDYRTLLGDKTVVANPTMPYIPGGDVAGTIVQSPSHEYNKGDRVMATWHMYGRGGLADYALVDPKFTVKLPDTLSFVQGAALANSASHAIQAVKQAQIQPGDRVLVLGASGGVGSIVIQLLSKQQDVFVAATSTDIPLMKKLGVDCAINYKEQEWSEMKEFQQDKFDCIIDCAEGKSAWFKCQSVLKGKKEGGRFVAVVPQDWHIDVQHWYQLVSYLAPPLGRLLKNVVRWSSPRYVLFLNTVNQEQMQKAVDMASSGKFEVILDPKSPHPFTTEGVRGAFNQHIARKGHGKIVIQVVDE